MSWDAELTDDRGHLEGQWGYTHNTSCMIYAACPDIEPPWWKTLDGTSGPEGAAYLDRIISALEADPDRYREMNPSNEWGDYDSLLKVLADMRNAVPEWPTKWEASG